MFTLESSAFGNGESIPKKYTGQGADVSPPLAWSDAPENTQAYALICEDPDAPRPKPWVHWLLANIPGAKRELAEGEDAGAVAGKTDFGKAGYGGPMPPSGHGTHHYHFTLYALDGTLDVSQGASKEDFEQAMTGHVLDKAELVGTYER